MTYRISASAHSSADRDALFAQITDLGRLPQWNRAITEVIVAPDAPLRSGSIWKVKVHAMGRSWVSRSEACVVDKAGGRFAYRSQSDDGNPSYAVWEWQLEPSAEGTRVTMSVDLEPLTTDAQPCLGRSACVTVGWCERPFRVGAIDCGAPGQDLLAARIAIGNGIDRGHQKGRYGSLLYLVISTT